MNDLNIFVSAYPHEYSKKHIGQGIEWLKHKLDVRASELIT